MLRQLRHDVWATETLIQRCRGLADEQLDLTVPGTYGTIRHTLTHILVADENYLVRLLGVVLHEERFRDDHEATLDELAAHLGHVKAGLERLFAAGEFEPDRVIPDTPLRAAGAPRLEMAAWVPLTQFVHHGSDHRAQIGTILGAHGLPTPDLQVWPYARESGATREVGSR
jgi:uncharacterized damage-inducible protein DinB